MREIEFKLLISASEYERYYSGDAKAVVVSADDGQTIRFPASAIQKFVSRDGISGRFAIQFDDNNRLIEILRISG